MQATNKLGQSSAVAALKPDGSDAEVLLSSGSRDEPAGNFSYE